jgi:hypothetical protein
MTDIVAEFTKCLATMSHSRAGWDYELSKEQRAKEDRELKEALKRAREIWADNPDAHDALRKAFVAANPLAQMSEIVGTAGAAG